MDIATASQLALLAAGVGGGWMTGRRGVARQTVEMLETQVNILTTSNETKEVELTAIRTRVEVLEGLVTQRAAVSEVHEELQVVHGKVDQILDRMLP